MLCRTILTCVFLPGLAGAAEDVAGDPKFVIDGPILIYDTEAAEKPADREIQNDDVDILLDLLRRHEGLTTLKLNSTGGSVWAGQEIARMVSDYELDTLVEGECSSSCTIIFLGGASRRMERGAKIGFHQNSWSPGSIQSYYENWREDEGWDTPFDFAAWVYEDTQSEMHREMLYMMSRGVTPEFAIETKRLRASMWFPTRAELVEAGVLVD